MIPVLKFLSVLLKRNYNYKMLTFLNSTVHGQDKMYKQHRTIQNFGERKFWWNNSHQKLADNILKNAQNFQNA